MLSLSVCILLYLFPSLVQSIPAALDRIPLTKMPRNMVPGSPLASTAIAPLALLQSTNAVIRSPSKATSASSTPNVTKPLVMGYYPSWACDRLDPKRIDFAKYDYIDFAFGMLQENCEIAWDDDKALGCFLELVTEAHARGCKVKLSIGGWTGSKYFSTCVATGESRTIFADNIFSVFKAYNLDGIDIDWEYPGRQGAGENQVNSDDSANFLLFLRLLRDKLPPDAKISAATQTTPFADASGQPMLDVADYAACLDWITLMNYDVWGSSLIPGPNAPLYDGCKNSSQPEANAVSGYNTWTSAGFPASQIVLGVPSYAYISKSTTTGLRTRSAVSASIRTTNLDSPNSVQRPFTVTGTDDQVQFRELVEQGVLILVNSSDTSHIQVSIDASRRQGLAFEASNGFFRMWDECSSTPYLHSPSAHQTIPYDDPTSMGVKAQFVKKAGMCGVNMFDIHGDTDGLDLIRALRHGLELN